MNGIGRIVIAVILFSNVHMLCAQKNSSKALNEYAATDKKSLEISDSLTKTPEGIAAYIKSNFHNDTERARAIFIWIASNIQYDVDNMFAMNFYEKKEDKINKVLSTRKGICENYAVLFSDVCEKSGIASFVIEGYTKQNGFADYIPHAWCAALIDSTWFLFDPTWGSGYVSNGKFYKKINSNYFKAQPSTLIKSHMPFDFLWEFLNYPVTNQEFYESKTLLNKSKSFFNYQDSIREYEKQSHIEQLISAARRIEKNGLKNSLIFDRLQHIKLEIEGYKQTEIISRYNSAANNYNYGINNLNDFINYRNKQFEPKKSDSEIQSTIDSAGIKFKRAKLKLSEIKNADATTNSAILQLNKSIDDASVHLKEQQDWLKEYFSKGKAGRKSMFYKYTWFGIPIN